ncbi:hypothetical protein EUGRSUZ_D00103 [Eucalyptus grandis]|uniref:Uncharacterized protein n=2 Tax=Eucalyptus grandis TaxID=71139 RepID=A0ACC3L1V0_EUCGR|nr:hypothetical protein EUGRSUZ_D00103 [Eucalyptus grandis]
MPMEIGDKDDSVEMLKNIHISSHDDDRDDDADPEEVEDLMNDDDDDDDEDDDEVQKPVTLGFVEKPKNEWSLLRQLFPSKAGGAPAWLDPDNLPSGRSRLCDICEQPLQFLLQVYAPTSDRESTFHRTLYLFTCPSMSCLLRDQHEQWKRPAVNASRSVKVFRCQLPRDNPFYLSEPPRHDGSDKPLGSGAPLCNWCGTWKGDKICGSCREARYCSEKHQAMHWRSGHKVMCQNSSRNAGSSSADDHKPASRSLWPEHEIVNEDEAEYDVDVSADLDNTNCLVSRNQMDDSINSLVKSFQGDSDRRSWGNFQERVARAPEQVLRACPSFWSHDVLAKFRTLRYCRNVCSKPLWPISSGQPSAADIPNCSYCGKPRCFEFQVLPQLLYFFGVKNDVDSLDWATIAVYSCEESCDGAASYKEEFAWVQVSSPSQVVP